MSRKFFVVAAGLAFLMSMVSMYFGASIHNANENVHVQYLNEMDHIYYYDAEMVPGLTRIAAKASIPFLVLILGLEIFILFKTKVAASKKIAIALSIIAITLLVMAILTIRAPLDFDFSKWGFAWVFGGLFTIAGNVLSAFLRPK